MDRDTRPRTAVGRPGPAHLRRNLVAVLALDARELREQLRHLPPSRFRPQRPVSTGGHSTHMLIRMLNCNIAITIVVLRK